MTYSSIYPFYYCSPPKNVDGDDVSFAQVTALTPAELSSDLWRIKNCHNQTAFGISQTTNPLIPKQSLGNFLPFGTTIDFNSAYIDAQVKVEKPELSHFDGQPTQNPLAYGANSQDICLSSHRKYSIESMPGLYRDTCSPFGNHLGDNSSIENSPQPFFNEHEFISSPVIQSPKSPDSYLYLQDSVFHTTTAKSSSSPHSSNTVQHSNSVYPPSLMSNHLAGISQRHHPYYPTDLEAQSHNEYSKVAQSLDYNLPVELGSRHSQDLKNGTNHIKGVLSHSDTSQIYSERPMTAGQRNKPSNRPPTSMMTTFSSKVTSPSAKRYHCGICQKGFSRPSSLNTHMYSHTGEKPFQCPYQGCGRHFSVVSNLRRHTKIHNEKAT